MVQAQADSVPTDATPAQSRRRPPQPPRFERTGSAMLALQGSPWSPSTSGAASGCPRRAQIFAHLERARNLIAGDLAGKGQVHRIAVLLSVSAADADRVAVDVAGDLARHELAL